jgi:hypothetical protein
VAQICPQGLGREEFAVTCSRCHALPGPRDHSPEDWPTVYARMERNMDRMQVLGELKPHAEEILLYLEAVSKSQ